MFHKFIIAALASGAVSCAPLGNRYYLTETPRTVLTPKADSIIVHIDDKLMVQMDAILLLGRKEQLEQGACLRVEKIKHGQVYVDSLLSAWVDPAMTTAIQIRMSCGADQVPAHWHVVYSREGWDQCEPSDLDFASTKVYPAAVLQCGMGVDSVVVWRAR